jgi:hypothetical protein
VMGTPAGKPSSRAINSGPWDSPAVSQRNMVLFFHAKRSPYDAGSPTERIIELKTAFSCWSG